MTLDLYALRRDKGGVVSQAGRAWLGPGPGHSRHDASLSVKLADDDRVLVHSFAGDAFRDCAAYLGLASQSHWGQAAAEEARRMRNVERVREREEVARWAAAVWARCEPLPGTQAAAYLRSRGLDGEPANLRYHPLAPRFRPPWTEDRSPPAPHPAMLALVSDLFGRPAAIHATYLRDGRKAFGDRSRLLFGSPDGGAIRLSPVGADGVLAIAEGIETAASFELLHGVPTWSTISAAGLQGFLVPASVRRLIITVDADDKGVSQRSAEKLSRRVRTSPRRLPVEIAAPPEGFDWNDVLVADLDGRELA